MKNPVNKYSFTLFGVLFHFLVFPQGIINNGAKVVFRGSANMYIDGNANGDYSAAGSGIVYPTASGKIVLEGDWTNNSTNTGFNSDSGTVVLSGANQVIKGSSSTYFYNLTLQGTGVKTQSVNTFVGGKNNKSGVLSLNTLAYNLNSFTLTATNPNGSAITNSSGYIISETNLAVNPSCLTWNMSSATGMHIFPFGTNSGIQIPFYFNKTSVNTSTISVATRPTATSDNLPWSAPVTSMFSPVVSGDASIPAVIDRWWDIVATDTVNGDAVFSYLGSENTLGVPNNIGALGAQNWNSAWSTSIGSNMAVLSSVGTVTANGISVLPNSAASSPWVLSSINSLLPIALTDFTISCSGNENSTAKWSTESEKNVSHFELLNSSDAMNFIKVGEAPASGNSLSRKSYSLAIDNRNEYGMYYKLKTIDANLMEAYSEIITFDQVCYPEKDKISMYCNPNNELVIDALSLSYAVYELEVIDSQGKAVYRNSLSVGTGSNEFKLAPVLAQGIYIVNLKCNDNKTIIKKISIL